MGLFGGGAGKAAKAAQRAERQKAERVSANVGLINRAFAGREADYGAYGNALRQRFGTQLQQAEEKAARQRKFAVAGSGNTGGSLDIDTNAQLARENNEAALNAETQVQAGVGKLKSADNQARLTQISLAQSGGDIGNAANQTAAALQANLANAQGDNTFQGLGELFGGTADLYKQSQVAAQRRRGLKDSEIYVTGTK